MLDVLLRARITGASDTGVDRADCLLEEEHMSSSRWARMAPLTGVGFVVLLAAGVVTINYYEFMPSAEDAKAFFEAKGCV